MYGVYFSNADIQFEWNLTVPIRKGKNFEEIL